MAEAMQGTLEVESVLGQGSTFWIELPLSHAEARAGDPAHDAPSTWSAPTPSAQDARVPQVLEEAAPAARTVLCIEDNASNFKLIERVLEGRRWLRLVNAVNGEAGLEMAFRLRPDLILLDLNLPDINGDELLRRLRADARTHGTRIVMVSADATESQRKKLLDGGADSYITKPFDIHELRRAVDSLQPALAPRVAAAPLPSAAWA